MITAQELRIGNWVTDLTRNRIVSIEGIEPNQDFVWVNYLNGFGQYKVGINNIEAIPLTPEILEKCGFEKKQWTTKGIEITCHYYQLNNIVVYLLKGFFEIELITKAGQFNMSKSWNYLHQLQNLYWCLCGKELIFKP